MSPKTNNVGFIKACQELLPRGVTLKQMSIDAAGYQHQVIDYLRCHGIEFVIRGATNDLIMTDIAALSEPAWQPLQSRDGSLSTDEWVARCTHTMYRSTLTFDFVVQRTRQHPAAKMRSREKADGTYEYQMIATNIKDLGNAEIVHHYNQRGEHSENRIKELKSHFAAVAHRVVILLPMLCMFVSVP